MKIYLLPLPPPLPPAVPQKTAPTAFEIEQMTEELVATARHWRTQRAKLQKIRKDPQRSDKDVANRAYDLLSAMFSYAAGADQSGQNTRPPTAS
jgi:hypothetical protein